MDKGVFRCFHPDGRGWCNTLDLWAAHQRLKLRQSAEGVAGTFSAGLTSPQKPVTEERNPQTVSLSSR